MNYREHIFVCLNQKADDKPCCLARGSQALFDQLREDLKNQPDVRVNKSGCLGECAQGPVIVAYPSGEWLTHATAEDCKTLAQKMKA
jgi:(2Fe-2S) ferredoxin